MASEMNTARETYLGAEVATRRPDTRTEAERVANRETVAAWFTSWRCLTPAQQDAWHKLPLAEQEATKRLTAVEFTAFMQPFPVKSRIPRAKRTMVAA